MTEKYDPKTPPLFGEAGPVPVMLKDAPPPSHFYDALNPDVFLAYVKSHMNVPTAARQPVHTPPKPVVDQFAGGDIPAPPTDRPVLAPVYFQTESGAWVQLNDPDVLVGVYEADPAVTVAPQPTAWVLEGDAGDQHLVAASDEQVADIKAAGLL